MDAITISETDEHQSASSNDKRLHLALLVRIGMPILTKLASVIFGLERIPDLRSSLSRERVIIRSLTSLISLH